MAVTERSFGFEQSADGLAEAAGLSTSSGLRQNHWLKEQAKRWNTNWINRTDKSAQNVGHIPF